MFKHYEKLPFQIRAVRYAQENARNPQTRSDFVRDVNEAVLLAGYTEELFPDGGKIYVRTGRGTIEIPPGDWLILGEGGELYPCKHSVFIASHRPAGEQEGYVFCP